MPSSRKQFSVRMTDETAARVDRLMPIVARAVGVELAQSQFFALAVAALEEKHGVTDAVDAPTEPEEKPAPKKKPKK